MVDFLYLEEPVIDEAAWDKSMVRFAPAAAILTEVDNEYAACKWDATTLHDVTLKVGESHGVKLGKAQAPIRVAVTGRSVGPPLFESLVVLGRDRTLARLESARARLGPSPDPAGEAVAAPEPSVPSPEGQRSPPS